MESNLHPIFEQALRPFMPPTQAELHAADAAVERHKATYHQRNDARALHLQINRPQTAEGWAA